MTAQPIRWGMTVPFDDQPLGEQRDRFVELADLGYTDVWSAEANGHDAFTPLALASVWAPSLRLGTAIVPAYTRGRATLAQCVGSIAQAREVIRQSFSVETYEPREAAAWDEAYTRFTALNI